MTPNGADKGAALARLCSRLDIVAEEVIAFGDNYNDLTMLEWAGRGVAMGNALDRVKETADEVTYSKRRVRRRSSTRGTRVTEQPQMRGAHMRRPFDGWIVVSAVFIQLMTSSGLAFYGLAIYLDALTDKQAFSTTTVSLATSMFSSSAELSGSS